MWLNCVWLSFVVGQNSALCIRCPIAHCTLLHHCAVHVVLEEQFHVVHADTAQHVFCLANAMALALSAHTPWVQLVNHISACRLTGLGFMHT